MSSRTCNGYEPLLTCSKTMNRVVKVRIKASKRICQHCVSRAGGQCLPVSGQSLKAARYRFCSASAVCVASPDHLGPERVFAPGSTGLFAGSRSGCSAGTALPGSLSFPAACQSVIGPNSFVRNAPSGEGLGMRIVELIRWTRHIEPPLALV